MLSEHKRKKEYESMVKNYYNLVTRGYREIWGSDYFHPHFWKDGQTKEEALKYNHDYIIEKMHVSNEAEVGDFGCGIGTFSFYLAEKFSHVTAINFNKKQLNIAKKSAKERKIKNVDFIEADIMRISYENKFDAIILHDVAPHLPDKKKALRIIKRALKPGGKLILIDWLQPDEVLFAAKTLFIKPFNSAWAFPYMESDENYRKYFKELNFNVIMREDWTQKIGKSLNDGYYNYLNKVSKLPLKDVAKILDLSSFLSAGSVIDKAHEMTRMVLYSKALYDAGLFLYYFYILEKK